MELRNDTIKLFLPNSYFFVHFYKVFMYTFNRPINLHGWEVVVERSFYMPRNTTKDRNLNAPKTYRIYRLYKFVFESCLDVFGKRDPLTNALIKKFFNDEEIEDIPTYTKAILVEKMLDELQKHEKPMEDLNHILNNERLKKLKKYMVEQKLEWDGVREYIHFRILPAYRDFISSYATGVIGEVLELAIANFLNDCTEFEFRLIEISFRYHVSNQASES